MSHLKVCLSTSFCYIYCLLLTHSSTISPFVTQFHLLSYNCFWFLSPYNMLLSIFLISSFLKFRQTISLGGHLEGLSLHCWLFSGSYIWLSLTPWPFSPSFTTQLHPHYPSFYFLKLSWIVFSSMLLITGDVLNAGTILCTYFFVI